MRIEIVRSIADIPAVEWNGLQRSAPPFLDHAFLAALEENDCVGERFGWLPRHIAIRDDKGRLTGATPLYEKDNSYGEFVFDWAWAEAWQRNGIPYYPKLVSAVPYTPATGPRILASDAGAREAIIRTACELSESENCSTIHWLFTDEVDTRQLRESGWLMRLGCQFHWQNQDYTCFRDFLDSLTAKKRKNILRERRQANEADIDIRVVPGHHTTSSERAAMAHFYSNTFDRKYGVATLNAGFFDDICSTMGERLVLFLASRKDKPVAAAICFRSDDTLYGRHWGCDEQVPGLHFELCYYQGIEYCIQEGLKRFEPGAQGEHKISRGFLPTRTWSAHRIETREFRTAVADFVRREEQGMEHYIQELETHSPYRKTPESDPA